MYKRQVLEFFVECGAPARVLTDAAPHVGTDVLSRVVVRLSLIHISEPTRPY